MTVTMACHLCMLGTPVVALTAHSRRKSEAQCVFGSVSLRPAEAKKGTANPPLASTAWPTAAVLAWGMGRERGALNGGALNGVH